MIAYASALCMSTPSTLYAKSVAIETVNDIERLKERDKVHFAQSRETRQSCRNKRQACLQKGRPEICQSNFQRCIRSAIDNVNHSKRAPQNKPKNRKGN